LNGDQVQQALFAVVWSYSVCVYDFYVSVLTEFYNRTVLCDYVRCWSERCFCILCIFIFVWVFVWCVVYLLF